MKNYKVTADEESCHFSFQSVGVDLDGREHVINKVVELQRQTIVLDGVELNAYNLFLGDVLPDGRFSDSTRSNNGDLDIVLSTVAHCVVQFFSMHPDAIIYFQGSDNVRTRLYRQQLSKSENYKRVTDVVDVYGISDERGIFAYEPNIVCKAFLIRMKK